MMQMKYCRMVLFYFLIAVLMTGNAKEKEDDNMLPLDDLKNKTNTTVIIGASYARAWSIESIQGKTVINKGVDGNQSFEMLARFKEDVLDQNPDTVIIWGFINDIFRSDSGNMENTLSRIKNSYEEMCKLAIKKGINTILATEVTIREPSGFSNQVSGLIGSLLGKKSYQDYINGHVIEMNKWLKQFARSKQLSILDFEKVLSGAGRSRKAEYATDDGSHIAEAAYDRLSAYVVEEME
ncbi:MAG: hypothetical protein KAS48_02915 [Gammaproteobacteria bacterium]|nr:hypothetical protein [Gammaproteobacteria bacterium]